MALAACDSSSERDSDAEPLDTATADQASDETDAASDSADETDAASDSADETDAANDETTDSESEETVEPVVLEVNLIPIPQEMTVSPGSFTLSESTEIVAQSEANAVAELLAGALRPATGYEFTVREGTPDTADVMLELDPDLGLGSEGYTLDVTVDGVQIRSETAAGLFYGCQTLRLLLPDEIESDSVVADLPWVIPTAQIRDWPRFEWRGTMLDLARHFFGPDDIREHIDMISLHKLNRLHLHLTDDQGWRLEILSWPNLALIGGRSEVGGGEGGFLTQEEYTDLVAFAAERFVTIVPEIDMPGHTNAATSSYGELNEDGEPTEPYTGTRVGFSSLWLDGEITREFVRDVLGEVADLTPGPWIHIGGDESRATDPEDYVEFIEWVQTVLDDEGKILVGWDDVADADLSAGYYGQYWVSPSRAATIAEQGGFVISSPAAHAYLDMKYNVDTPIGHIWAGLIDTRTAYEWDPVPEGVDESSVVGLEGPLWTESTETWDDIEFLAWPRLAGLAEMGWSPATALDWEEYRVRLGAHGSRLDALEIGFWRSPLVDWDEAQSDE